MAAGGQEAIGASAQAVDLNPQNFKAIYLLAEEVERQADSNSEAEYQQLMQKILAVDPTIWRPCSNWSRVSIKRGDNQTLRNTVASINARSSAWPQEVQEQLSAVQAAVAGQIHMPQPPGSLNNVCWCAFLNIARVFL